MTRTSHSHSEPAPGFVFKIPWRDLRREARSSFASFAIELPPGNRDKRGWDRLWWFARVMFFRLTPARRAILLFALVLQLSSLILAGHPAQWVSTSRAFLSFVCLLVLVALELTDRVSLKRDLELTREIQSWLVPTTPPHFDRLDIAFGTRPANTVSGDYYDVLSLPAASGSQAGVLFVVADVAGKGIPAGLLTACFRSCLHTLADTAQDVRTLAQRLHRSCCGDSGGGRHFTSAFLARYEDATRSLCYVNAGHNPPLLRRAAGSIALLGATGMPFGMFRDATYDSSRIPVEPGDLLLIYTDGVVEAANEVDDEYGLDRLTRFVRQTAGSSGDFHRRLLDSIDAFTAGAPQHDDITCMIIQFSA